MAELAVCKTPPPPGSAAWQQMAAANGSGATTSMNGGYGESSMVDSQMGGVRGSPMSASSAAHHRSQQQPQHAGMYTLPNVNGGMSHPHNNISYTTPEKVGRTDLQADTPPQTPPNNNKLLPLNSHQQSMSMGSGSHMGQGHMHGVGGGANNVINPVSGMAESLSRYQHHPYGGYHSHHSPLDAADGGMSGPAGYHPDHSHQQYDSLAAITAEDCYNS